MTLEKLDDSNQFKNEIWDPVKELNFNDHHPSVDFNNPYKEMIDKDIPITVEKLKQRRNVEDKNYSSGSDVE